MNTVDIFILGVPLSDVNDLKELAGRIIADPEFVQHKYFDGAEFVETILPVLVTGAAWATLRTWISARADLQKATRVSIDGVEIVGMKRKDAERIIERLSRQVRVQDGGS